MQAVGTILVLVWMAMIVIGVIALLRGHIDLVKICNRKSAGFLLLRSIPVFVVAGPILPKSTSYKTTPAPASAPTTIRSAIPTPATPATAALPTSENDLPGALAPSDSVQQCV